MSLYREWVEGWWSRLFSHFKSCIDMQVGMDSYISVNDLPPSLNCIHKRVAVGNWILSIYKPISWDRK